MKKKLKSFCVVMVNKGVKFRLGTYLYSGAV